MNNRCLQALIGAGSEDAEAYYNCGVDLYQAGDLLRAVEAWTKAIEFETMTDYERFRVDFKQHISDVWEELGEEVFFKRYPIKGFDGF